MKVKHFFLPHPHTHKKAHLLSVKAFLVYVVLFVVLQNGISFYSKVKPGVLGVSSVIDYHEIIRLTNVERQKNGLSALTENQALDSSAYAKGENMYQENYWAHYSPSGKDPWGFMKTAGYSFTYAGENLAKNFYTAQDVVNAWMNSPTHRDNILGTHYTEIGISVNEGILDGQKTILVVQHFGRPIGYVAQNTPPKTVASAQTVPKVVKATPKPKPIAAVVTPAPSSSSTPEESPLPEEIVLANTQPIPPINTPKTDILIQGWSLDPYQMTRIAGLAILGFIAFLIGLDLYIIRKRLIHRFATHHLSHFALLSLSMSSLMHSVPGQIM